MARANAMTKVLESELSDARKETKRLKAARSRENTRAAEFGQRLATSVGSGMLSFGMGVLQGAYPKKFPDDSVIPGVIGLVGTLVGTADVGSSKSARMVNSAILGVGLAGTNLYLVGQGRAVGAKIREKKETEKASK